MDTHAEITKAIRNYRSNSLGDEQWKAIADDLRRRARRARPTSVEDARKLCQAGARLVRELDGHVDWSTFTDLCAASRRVEFLKGVATSGASTKTIQNLRRRLERLSTATRSEDSPVADERAGPLPTVGDADLVAARSAATGEARALLDDVLAILRDGPSGIRIDRRRVTVRGVVVTTAWARRQWLVKNDGEKSLVELLERGVRVADLNAALQHLRACD